MAQSSAKIKEFNATFVTTVENWLPTLNKVPNVQWDEKKVRTQLEVLKSLKSTYLAANKMAQIYFPYNTLIRAEKYPQIMETFEFEGLTGKAIWNHFDAKTQEKFKCEFIEDLYDLLVDMQDELDPTVVALLDKEHQVVEKSKADQKENGDAKKK
jgi:hypothetical protein